MQQQKQELQDAWKKNLDAAISKMKDARKALTVAEQKVRDLRVKKKKKPADWKEDVDGPLLRAAEEDWNWKRDLHLEAIAAKTEAGKDRWSTVTHLRNEYSKTFNIQF